MALVRHLETGNHHCCYVRMWLKGGNTISFNPATPRIKAIAETVLGRHRQWEIAIVIGAPPSVAVIGAIGLPGSVDDLAVAQVLQPNALTLYNTPIPVPRTTEFVLFGRVFPEFVQEAAIGDFRGTYPFD